MPTVPLPEQPSLDQLRNQARELQRAIAAGDAATLAHAAEHSPSGDASTLSRAQLVIARHYGFASWPRLRCHLRAVQRYSRAASCRTIRRSPGAASTRRPPRLTWQP